MEDEDIEGQVTDAWTFVPEAQSPQVEETLKRTSRVLSDSALSPRVSYNDVAQEENKEDRCSSDGSEDSPGKYEIASSKIVFKGFKKRILAQAQENQVGAIRRNSHDSFLRNPREKRGKITEYAQYLGLQPAASNTKTKCTKCNLTSNNTCPQSMLKPHQCTCPPGSTAGRSSPGTSETTPPSSIPNQSSAPSAANNFRITRKVYLCAACGTYFENWNLFLHMREIHKRHICLFCLGMFGQAERLSYHLAKKHSVPETSFTSVEDFYNVFKGSCYLICCTCEKVFSETDNFYNHFCSPVIKGRSSAASEVCSLCRQSGNHSNTCSLAEPRETLQNPSGLPGVTGNPGITCKEASGVRNKRMQKNNRLKRSEESLLMSYQQKLSEMYARKMKMKSREGIRETASSGDESAASLSVESLETATTTTPSVATENEASKSSRDTVSETIMEVSKCTDDSRGNKTFGDDGERVFQANSKCEAKIESSPCPSPSASPSRSPSPLRRQSDASLYDSVAETIMEVSRCSNDSQDNTSAEEDDEEENSRNETRRESRDTGSEADVLVMDDVADLENDAESANGKEDYDDRLMNLKNERRKKDEETREEETIEASDSDTGSSSNPSENESPARLNTTGDTENRSSPEKESQTTSVSFTTVNATDRSLVIKICTNRNSQFSVTSANGTSYGENHETSRESEENNNGEDSASDKHSNHSGRTSPNSFRADEDDDEEQSDSDTGKLAVVDEEKTEIPAVTAESEKIGEGEKKEEEGFLEERKNESIGATNLNDDNQPINVEDVASASEAPEDDANVLASQKPPEETDGIILAAEDVPSIDLNVEGLLESMEIEDLLKRCISAASGYCVYCNHARHIAVNGKQLSLHVLAEHRFQPQHPAIIINREQFTARVKKSIDEVDARFFNLNTFNSEQGTYDIQNPRVFECFHCRFHSLIHKDIYLHNRKMHQKTILICIMCKSTFYSYSELLCHLCPGVYSPNINVTYRCCLCTVSNLPSAFRLMVHLRKRHHSCDVCLESTGNQQRLSNHVWKHKLHHLCYRCGIAYRNKPDITKHLFWKHGTESVLCKKCLQKKWPHVYHFCIPPTAFVCEECTSTFSRAVALKVHKRLHSGDRPYGCSECADRFISKKLLAKHEISHREPEKLPEVAPREKTPEKEVEEPREATETTSASVNPAEPEVNENTLNETKEPKEIVKKVVDVYDLPPLNLSSESDSDSEDQTPPETTVKSFKDEETKVDENKPLETKKAADSNENADAAQNIDGNDAALDPEVNEEVKTEEAQIMDGIWDNFKSYAASLEKTTIVEPTIDEKEEEARLKFLCEVILADHDYCVVSTEKTNPEELKEDAKVEDNCGTMEGEHDYGYKQTKSPSTGSVVLNCDSDTNAKKKKEKSPKKRKQNGSTSSSDSSSDSDSSSCSCGTNCSCSSSSSGSSSSSSSSSDSDSSASENSPKKSSSARRERRKEKEKEAAIAEAAKDEVKIETVEEVTPEVPKFEETPQQNEEANQSIEICEPPRSPQLILRESDLDTDETETDEDFYDEHPQQLANKLLAEKRNQLMLLAAVAPASNDPPALAGATSGANNLNNGQIDTETSKSNSIETVNTNIEAETRNSTARGQTRKRVKTKKRKKSERAKSSRVLTPTVESIKLNIPKSFYQKKQPGFNSATPAIITVLPSRSSTPNLQNSQPEGQPFAPEANKTNMRLSVGGSGSENENKRSSKRKRVPKRFYGDSSDEEAERQQQQQQQQQQQHIHYSQPNFKWRKVDNPSFVPTLSIKTQPTPSVNFPTKNVTLRLSGFDQPLERIVPMNTVNVASATESEEPAESSSAESSEAEDNLASQPSQPITQQPRPTIVPTNPSILPTNPTGGPERPVNLYCYCQCPYDEVSEMIACDGDDCRIEWFHFECVGIMVPPKGKWYCPDCRKKDASLPSNEDYFD